MEMQQRQRQTAYKVPISALLNNQYVEQQGFEPNYLKINDKQVSRVNLLAVVIDKQVSSSLATLTLDDSTGIIQVRYFNDDVKKAADINLGDTVLLIGKPRKFNDQIFLAAEITRKTNPAWMKIRKIELKKEFNIESDSNGQQQKEAKQQMNSYNGKILDFIKEKDNGSGVDIDEIISNSGLKENEAREAIVELVKLGEIYEPRPNKIRILG
ncbi:hypothetical protein HYV89_02990 [Candidatus Woesearchaeota archaeon]|nr:hypothetical protein [Candidatus Woesearchaeota archaeon]